jgi:asparagine synthase (glutamine-hydrolysing)
MCGITGQLLSNGESVNEYESTIRRLIGLMARRGPDDEGYWSDGKHCALGFRRLSILDLSPAGHQPMLTHDSRYAIVFNGEVYNFRELRQELEAQGVPFRSQGDTEVVLQSLVRWGKGVLDRFNGMFALAFFDIRDQKLLLARDHAGIKPLYYLRTDNGLVFASQYDQILQHPWTHREKVSESALALYLKLGHIPAPYGILEHTHMLQPGSWLEIDAAGKLAQGSFFEMPVWQLPDLFAEEALEALEGALQKAVRRHLISDVPVGVFLSGGIDSPLVASYMRAISKEKFPAFTIATRDARHDESTQAQTYANELGFEHIVRLINSEDALAMLDQVVDACGEPFADFSIFPTLLVSQMAHQKVKVVLSGDGGDELFWGYVSRMAPVIEQAGNFSQPMWMQKARCGLRRYLGVGNGRQNLLHETVGDWYLEKHTHLRDSKMPVFGELRLPDEFRGFIYSGFKTDETAQWLRWNEYNCHLPGVLLKADRASMHHSLEVRVPLLDREVIQTAMRIDWKSCLNLKKQIGKIPLRRALAHRLSQQSDKKLGFSVPMDNWLRKELRPIFEDLVLNTKELVGLPVDPQAIRKLYDEHMRIGINQENSLWTLLSLALWERRHFRQSRNGVQHKNTLEL